MVVDLTGISAQEYNRIRMGSMTPEMAADYLKEGQLPLRSFQDVLGALYPQEDLQEKLIDAVLSDEPDARPASVAKTVRNWLSGKSRPTDRRDLFRIAFALSLSMEQADYLLGFCTGAGIHYRDLFDLVYAWFLRSGRILREADLFYASLPQAPHLNTLPPDYTTGTLITQAMQQDFQMIASVDELRAFCLRNLENSGALHLRAYHYFDRFMEHLILPQAAWDETQPQRYSLDAVMEEYLTLHMPSGKKRSGLSAVKKLIKYNWPSTTRLKNIHQHKEDVPRKLILLLYVVTENTIDDEYDEMDEAYISMEERLEDHWYGLNAILVDCGLPRLDPRNPFDWLVLYALAADEDEIMSERMEQVIEVLFREEDA